MRIGLLLTPFKEDQIQKEQYVKVKYRDWLNNLKVKDTIIIRNKKFAADDMSIFYYLREKFGKQHTFVKIQGNDDKLQEKVKSCDIVFTIIFDLLEAFHILPAKDFAKIKKAFQLPNVYPPYQYQFLINNKNEYYQYLEEVGINVLPFVHISAKEFLANRSKSMKKVFAMKRGDENKFIGKPIYGQESIDFKIFNSYTQEHTVEKYLEKISSNYTGCIFQPFVKNFDKIGEYRVFYIGAKQTYCINTKSVGYKQVPLSSSDPDIKRVFAFAQQVFDHLPKFFNNKVEISKLLTRIDIACCLQENKFFVSEIEFVPSLYLDKVDHLFIDKKLAEQMMQIVNEITPKKKVNLKMKI